MGFVDESVRRAKGFFFFSPLARVCLFYYGVSIGIRDG